MISQKNFHIETLHRITHAKKFNIHHRKLDLSTIHITLQRNTAQVSVELEKGTETGMKKAIDLTLSK